MNVVEVRQALTVIVKSMMIQPLFHFQYLEKNWALLKDCLGGLQTTTLKSNFEKVFKLKAQASFSK